MEKPLKFGRLSLQLVIYSEGVGGLDFEKAIKVQLSYKGAAEVGKQCCVSLCTL